MPLARDVAFARETLAGRVNDWPEHARRNAEAVLRLVEEGPSAEAVEGLRSLRSLVANLLDQLREDAHGFSFVPPDGHWSATRSLVNKLAAACREHDGRE